MFDAVQIFFYLRDNKAERIFWYHLFVSSPFMILATRQSRRRMRKPTPSKTSSLAA
jgi:hypothetical protein